MNNIYNKLVELQWQIQHRDPHMNSGDMIQIEAPDFDPDIDDISPTTTDQESNNLLIQGTASPILQNYRTLEIECITPAPSHQYTDCARNRLARCYSSRDSITDQTSQMIKD